MMGSLMAPADSHRSERRATRWVTSTVTTSPARIRVVGEGKWKERQRQGDCRDVQHRRAEDEREQERGGRAASNERRRHDGRTARAERLRQREQRAEERSGETVARNVRREEHRHHRQRQPREEQAEHGRVPDVEQIARRLRDGFPPRRDAEGREPFKIDSARGDRVRGRHSSVGEQIDHQQRENGERQRPDEA